MASLASILPRRPHSATSSIETLRFSAYSSGPISFASLLSITALALRRISLYHALFSTCDLKSSSKVHFEMSSVHDVISFDRQEGRGRLGQQVHCLKFGPGMSIHTV
jgi:hypothetical protein